MTSVLISVEDELPVLSGDRAVFQLPPEDEKQVIPVLIPDTIRIQSMYIRFRGLTPGT